MHWDLMHGCKLREFNSHATNGKLQHALLPAKINKALEIF